MKVNELKKALENLDESAEVILVVYTEEHYEAGYLDRIDSNVRYDSVTQKKLEDDEVVVELTTTTRRN